MDPIDALQEILESLGFRPSIVNLIILVTVCLTMIVSFLGLIFQISSKIALRKKQKFLLRQLNKSDYSNSDIYSHTGNYIQTRFTSEFSEAQTLMYDSENKKQSKKKRQKLVAFLLNRFIDKEVDQKYYMILADSGMGKTTFTINLFIGINRRSKSWFSGYELTPYLFPAAGRVKDLSYIQKIPNPETSVIIIDALDEYSEKPEETNRYLLRLLEMVKPFAQVVITCRTQFFPTLESQVPAIDHKTKGRGYEHFFKCYYLLPFNNSDVNKYLVKRFSPYFIWNLKKFLRAHKVVRKVPFLALRPMLLDHIAYFQDRGSDFNFSFEVYRELIDKWIDREALKIFSNKNAARVKYVEMLFLLCKRIAIVMYSRKEMDYSPVGHDVEILNRELLETLTKYSDYIDKESVGQVRNSFTYRSLLNRAGDNKYKFSHRSVFEYFITLELIENVAMFQKFEFPVFSMARVFFEEHMVSKLQKMKTPYTVDSLKKNTSGLTIGELPRITHLEINAFHEHLVSHLSHLKSLQSTVFDFEEFDALYSLYRLIPLNTDAFLKTTLRLVRETIMLPEEEIRYFFASIGVQRNFSRVQYLVDGKHWGTFSSFYQAMQIRDQKKTGLKNDYIKELAPWEQLRSEARYDEIKLDKANKAIRKIDKAYHDMLRLINKADMAILQEFKLQAVNKEVLFILPDVWENVRNRVVAFMKLKGFDIAKNPKDDQAWENMYSTAFDQLIVRLQTDDARGRETIGKINSFMKSITELTIELPECKFYY